MQKGDRGPAVKVLQTELRDLGYYVGNLDGQFGELTFNALVAIQKELQIADDGIVGPVTRDLLYRLRVNRGPGPSQHEHRR
jgi:peptidoglycan hydrolase-like protein with peptidoglycan-binding domain